MYPRKTKGIQSALGVQFVKLDVFQVVYNVLIEVVIPLGGTRKTILHMNKLARKYVSWPANLSEIKIVYNLLRYLVVNDHGEQECIA